MWNELELKFILQIGDELMEIITDSKIKHWQHIENEAKYLTNELFVRAVSV